MSLKSTLFKGATKYINGLLGGDNSAIMLSCDGQSLEIPVMPESFTCSVSNKNGTVNICNLGEYNMIGKTGLKTISLDSFFPANEYDFATGEPKGYGYIETLETWRTNGKPLCITIADSPITFPCLIENLSYTEKEGTGDVYYKLDLKEYKYIEPQTGKDATGLKKRPKLSFLQRAGLNAAKGMLQGQSPMKAITSAIGKSGLTPKQQGYLSIYKTVTKKGGMKVGDVLETGAKFIKVNGKNIFQ